MSCCLVFKVDRLDWNPHHGVCRLSPSYTPSLKMTWNHFACILRCRHALTFVSTLQDWVALLGQDCRRRRADSRLCGLLECVRRETEAPENTVLLWLHMWTLQQQNPRWHKDGGTGSGRSQGLCVCVSVGVANRQNASASFSTDRGDKAGGKYEKQDYNDYFKKR